MPRMKRTLALLLFAGCGGGTPATMSTVPDPGNPDPHCQAIASSPECLLPFPSSFYLAADGSTRTGLRVAYPKTGVLPPNQVGKPFDVTRLNLLDGFSNATTLLANLGAARVDDSSFPGMDTPDKALVASSPVQLFDFATGARVPLFAELDHNACLPDQMGASDEPSHCPLQDGETQLLIAHPVMRLQPGTRYVAALVKIVDTSGAPIRLPAFEALKGGAYPATSRLADVAPRYDEIWKLLDGQGVAKNDVTLAWDFTTASDEATTSSLIGMRDDALAAWESQKLGFTLTDNPSGQACPMGNECADPWSCDPNTHICGDDHLYRELLGTFDSPTFLDAKTSLNLVFDANGKPMMRGPTPYQFVVHVPKCALTAKGPLPVMVFGHGLFGSAVGEMRSGYEKQVIDQLCMVQIGTNWIGLSEDDAPIVAAHVLGNFDSFPIITDRLQQAQVNFLILAHMAVRTLAADPGLAINGIPIIDGKQVYYYGISQGGIEGNVFLALSSDVDRGVVNVGAGEYSLMMARSHDFKDLKAILDNTYPHQRDQQVLLALSQSFWDFADPIGFVAHTLKDRLPGPDGKPLSPRHVLQQESENDAQVPNVATRVVVRTMGLPLLTPSINSPWGIPAMAGPLDSAFTQWDCRPMPAPPPWDSPSPVEGVGDWMGYSAHEAIRRYPKLIDQLAAFLKPDGKVVDTCGGQPCSF